LTGYLFLTRTAAADGTSGERTQRARSGTHHASTCRWAVPTLFLQAPFWWEAEDRPWSCIRGTTPRVLATTEVCADCPYWKRELTNTSTAPVTTIDALRAALENAPDLQGADQHDGHSAAASGSAWRRHATRARGRTRRRVAVAERAWRACAARSPATVVHSPRSTDFTSLRSPASFSRSAGYERASGL
jgi:hypothetical protein